jgi:hypothetical protein
LAERIGAPTALKDIGMKAENLEEAVGLVLEAVPEDNPRPVDEAGVRNILENAYAGDVPSSSPKGEPEHMAYGGVNEAPESWVRSVPPSEGTAAL